MRRWWIVLMLVVGLVGGACGGGGDKDDVSAAGAGAASDDEKKTDTDFSGKGGGDFCDLAKKFEKDFEDQANADTPVKMKDSFSAIGDAIDKLAGKAPGEIKADVTVVGDFFKRVDALYKKYDYDGSKIPPAEAGTIDAAGPEMQAASNRIESYFEKVCKIDSDGDGDTDGVIDSDSSGSTDEEPPADEETTTTVEE